MTASLYQSESCGIANAFSPGVIEPRRPSVDSYSVFSLGC
jgi:hypothetical protein